jgi:hypothetical protein
MAQFTIKQGKLTLDGGPDRPAEVYDLYPLADGRPWCILAIGWDGKHYALDFTTGQLAEISAQAARNYKNSYAWYEINYQSFYKAVLEQLETQGHKVEVKK